MDCIKFKSIAKTSFEFGYNWYKYCKTLTAVINIYEQNVCTLQQKKNILKNNSYLWVDLQFV